VAERARVVFRMNERGNIHGQNLESRGTRTLTFILSDSGRGETGTGTLRLTRRSLILAHLTRPAAEPFAEEFYAAYTG
jgi:hypothetical protein